MNVSKKLAEYAFLIRIPNFRPFFSIVDTCNIIIDYLYLVS